MSQVIVNTMAQSARHQWSLTAERDTRRDSRFTQRSDAGTSKEALRSLCGPECVWRAQGCAL